MDSVDGTTVYTYDALGQLLTEKRNGAVVNTMTYDGYGNILTRNGIQYSYDDTVWKDRLSCYNGQEISYDANGQPYAMYYNSTPYFYILNLQGDVIRMVDGNGNTVASYEYDPYGRVISATGSMAEINPLRYRGYYDLVKELYYSIIHILAFSVFRGKPSIVAPTVSVQWTLTGAKNLLLS